MITEVKKLTEAYMVLAGFGSKLTVWGTYYLNVINVSEPFAFNFRAFTDLLYPFLLYLSAFIPTLSPDLVM